MVFNQLLWIIHFKVIHKLDEVMGYLDLNAISPCSVVPNDTKVFYEHVDEILREHSILQNLLKDKHVCDDFELSTSDKGLYLQAFYQGVFTVLNSLDGTIFKIEESYLWQSGISLLQIRNEFVYLRNVLISLNSALEKLKDSRYHGCKILDLCESYINSESQDIKEVFIKIQKFCLNVFYMQLKLWLVQVDDDPHEEFFIQVSNDACVINKNPRVSISPIEISCFVMTSNVSNKKYEVKADNLPSIIPFSMAVKILFIGESLILCQRNGDKTDINQLIDECGISRQNIMSQFSGIEKSGTFNMRLLCNFIDELWIKVNTYIRKISDEVGNVKSELILMWEIYLLGRDELFQEFLLKGGHLLNSDVTTVTARDLNVALRDAVYYVYVSENLNLIDQFFFKLPNRRALKQGLTAWSVLYLDCNIKWPLRYLFTPEVINLYNHLFCFLLRLKKAQMDLITAYKGISTIPQHSLRMGFIEVKVHLLSIVSNLQNYCLTFVIANEMNTLISSIERTTMFTDLQKALLLFLSNICSRLFLSDQNLNFKNSNIQTSEIHETVSKKVNRCFVEIFSLCGSFSELIHQKVNEDCKHALAKLKLRLFEILELMFSLLHRIDQNSCNSSSDSLHIYSYLHNLMMCLDYNKFYYHKFLIGGGY